MMAPIRATTKSTRPQGSVKRACKTPEKRLAPTAPAMMIAPAYQMKYDRSAKTMAMIMPTIHEVAVERNPVPKISCITRAPTKNPVTPPNTGSKMNQNRNPKRQIARPIRARMIPTRKFSMASLHPPPNVLDRSGPDRRRSRSRPWSDAVKRRRSHSHYTYTFREVNGLHDSEVDWYLSSQNRGIAKSPAPRGHDMVAQMTGSDTVGFSHPPRRPPAAVASDTRRLIATHRKQPPRQPSRNQGGGDA